VSKAYDTELTITSTQVEHLKKHEADVIEHQGGDIASVEEWLEGAEEDAPFEGYFYMCADLGIEPLPPHPAGA